MSSDPTGSEFRKYWTQGAGLKRWAGKPHPYTSLVRLLSRHVGEQRAKGLAAKYFRKVKGIWPGERFGDNPHGRG